MTHPCDLSAVDARRQIEEGSLSVSALLESCITRIESRNPEVNAVVATCYEDARQQAAEMDKARPTLPELPPLFGLPVLIKDLIETKGLATTYGSLHYKDHIPEFDAAVIKRLRDAGAIILGKTNTPEFGAGANTFNKVFGATRNPHNTDLTSGGSSGGSAVAVACGMAPLAIGSDFGGSLRIPASFCGVVGMRPTPGRVPCSTLAVGHSPLWTEGPMARSVADAALCMTAIEGDALDDPRAAPLSNKTVLTLIDMGALKVGISADLGLATLEHGIQQTFENVVSALSPCFEKVGPLGVDLSAAPEIFKSIRVMDVYARAYKLGGADCDKLGENVRNNLALAENLTFTQAAKAKAAHTVVFKEFQKLFDTYDILICPSTAVSPFPVGVPFPTEINGGPVVDYVDWYAVTWALSLMGCPIVSVPSGLDHKGMPFGIQIIAPKHQDALAFRAAAAVEAALAHLESS